MEALLGEIEFREPWLLVLGLLAVPVFLWARRSPGRVLFSSLSLVPARITSWRVRLAWLPDLALALAVLGLSVAAAGPRVAVGENTIRREGIAIMMVVDTSGSMRALDLADGGLDQTRLEVVKDVFRAFVAGEDGLDGRSNDTIGLVSFAGFADTRCPLTLNHGSLLTILDDLEIVRERAEDGTAIGDGLGLAVERLRESEASSRVIILLTDGVNNAGIETPLEAAELASRLGIKVYTIGAGTDGVAPVRVTNPLTGAEELRPMPVEIDEATLEAIAEHTGGRYFRATDGDGLRQVYEQIDRLERTEISERRLREYREFFQVPLALGMLLAALGWLLRATVFRRLPC
ncbi:VWA domain-containing protein [Haliangium ochraceum]|uniref:von Willebrand factor type A n=1 Tax=Haliangium ochraceum (strain DSM 14365 / JCM 11303 / SMP-2) TaxID=502025 RepID=D0LKC7_HALO1|nr:VWA domain-containing protein [Haliangium ochraceum]ACY13161.1 von Willebrand factor type A [Haliangium ochraceum DSM 14365]